MRGSLVGSIFRSFVHGVHAFVRSYVRLNSSLNYLLLMIHAMSIYLAILRTFQTRGMPTQLVNLAFSATAMHWLRDKQRDVAGVFTHGIKVKKIVAVVWELLFNAQGKGACSRSVTMDFKDRKGDGFIDCWPGDHFI